MVHKLSYAILFSAAVLLLLPPTVTAAEAGSEPPTVVPLQVHLPREVKVQDSLLTLGQVSVIKGDPALAAVAGAIGLGRLSMPGQKAVLDRATILSRLASSGVTAEQVRLTGAEAVTVCRHQKTITADEFIEAGRAFLRQHPPGPTISEVLPTTRPKDLILPGQTAELQLTPRFVRNGARGYVTVQIAVTADGSEAGVRDIPFRLRYQCHRAVTLQEIPEGAMLTPENVKVETTDSDQPEPAGWQPPYGLAATRTLAADTEIRRDMVNSVQSPLIIRRNERVVIRVERPGLLVTAVGTALQEARAGEYVKVRNADSSRVIVCKVNADGTVEPML
jgi:flagella basal body P-ring formation protein FlgA